MKAFEAEKAVEDGADELDMIINIGALKAGDEQTVKEDIEAAQHWHASPIEHYLYVCQEDLEVAMMYPDINEAEGVYICAYRPE